MNNNLPNKVDANITETLPNNIEAEKSLLGSVFWSYAALQKACEEIGIASFEYALDAETTEDELLALIEKLNKGYKIKSLSAVTDAEPFAQSTAMFMPSSEQ